MTLWKRQVLWLTEIKGPLDLLPQTKWWRWWTWLWTNEEWLQVPGKLFGLFYVHCMPRILDDYNLSTFSHVPAPKRRPYILVSLRWCLSSNYKQQHEQELSTGLKSHLFNLWPNSRGNIWSCSPHTIRVGCSIENPHCCKYSNN